MKKQFNKAYYLSHRGCYEKEKMSALVDVNPHSTIIEFIDWPISVRDKFYFIRHYTELTLKERQSLSLLCAKVSLDIYEKKYPNDKRVRECVEAIEAFNKGDIARDELMDKRADAYAAAAAAAAYAAYAAAYAAAAADAAAAYAAAAADADAYAAAAAAYAAYAAAEKTHTQRLLDAVKQWCNEQVDNDVADALIAELNKGEGI